MKILSTRKAILALFWLIPNARVFADSSFFANGFTFEIMKDQCSVSLTKYETVPTIDYSQPLHIPSSVTHEGKTYSVKRIKTHAFKDITEIQSVVIDEGIENLGEYVFERCVNLKSISIPASVECLGKGLFGSCYHLTLIKVDEKNECFDSRDGANAIIDSENDELLVACSSTKIPASVKSIADFAFYHCNVMEQIVIPEGVETIGNNVFFGCSSLQSISLPESLTEMGADVFCGCNSLTSIIIPKNVTKIGDCNLFQGCNNLISVVVDELNPYYDSRSHCNGIVRKSDSTLIATCRSTIITHDISALGSFCFSGTIIRSVNIPKSVTTIDDNAFEGCDEIEELNVSEDNPNYLSPKGSNALLSKDGKRLLLGCRTTTIPECVEIIGTNAFLGRYSKLVLRIPKNVKAIQMFAFASCNALCEVILPETLQSIDSYAFDHCVNLSVVQLLAPIPIKDNTFSECYSLSAISLPDGLESIGGYAFKGCKNLKHISIPSSVKHIDKTAFEGCPISELK